MHRIHRQLSVLIVYACLTSGAEWGPVAGTPSPVTDAFVATSAAPTGGAADVVLAGQVQLDQGRFLCGVRNASRQPGRGVVRFLDAVGTELKAPAFGFELQPGKTAWRALPIGTTTRDEPTIEYLLLLLNGQEITPYRGMLECRSGALERTPGEVTGTSDAQSPRPSTLALRTGLLPGIAVASTPVISSLDVLWQDQPLADWREREADFGRVWQTALRAGTAQVAVASLAFDLRENGRGDYLATLSYSIPMGEHSLTSAPCIRLSLPWSLVDQAVVARRIGGDYTFAAAGALDDDELISCAGPRVEEWGLVCADDWLYIDLDTSWAQVARAGDEAGADLELVLRSRAAVEPLRGGSAGTVQFFVHVPVGLK